MFYYYIFKETFLLNSPPLLENCFIIAALLAMVKRETIPLLHGSSSFSYEFANLRPAVPKDSSLAIVSKISVSDSILYIFMDNFL